MEAYVIGFDQCLVGLETNVGRGFLLATEKMDTVMTYNLPNSTYSFPEELFADWWLSPLFPDTAQKQYKVLINYRPANEEEFVSAVCPGYVVSSPVSMNARQVILVCAKK